jgi:GntR family transcriptional regulator of arabinose operon
MITNLLIGKKVSSDNKQYTSRQKFLRIYEILRKSIEEGVYKNDQQLPTEIELAAQHNLSRPTIAKALDMLRNEGLIERISGIGTFVRYQSAAGLNNFGLLIPGLGETEIFESICGHMSNLARVQNFNLIWSGSMHEDAAARKEHIEQLAGRYIEQQINGVFFTPLELTSQKDPVNQNIVELFDKAGIPVVLMDRDIVSFPARSRYDLVGVDNFRLAFILTRHLLEQGCTNIRFVARPYSAPTVQMRIFGYQQALREAQMEVLQSNIFIEDNYTPDFCSRLLNHSGKTGVLCANDTTASRLMHSLTDLGYKIPGQVMVAGVDDIKYATYLRVPLTTYKQPCKDIAKVAIDLMMSRIRQPNQKARTVYLDGELIVRKSTGG